jgi:carbon monoxide dehydrogenase subunit G
MSIQPETSTEIERPVEEVFDYVTSVEHNVEWEPRVVESPPAEGEMGVGTTWHPVVEGLRGTSETTMKCIEYDPPTSFGYTTPAGMMGGRLKTEEALYTFTQEGDRTRVEWSGTIEVSGLLPLLQPVLARSLRSDLNTSLENLKTQLEANTSGE